MLHPFYKFHLIESQWGGAEDAAKDPDQVDWVKEARTIVEKIVRPSFLSKATHLTDTLG